MLLKIGHFDFPFGSKVFMGVHPEKSCLINKTSFCNPEPSKSKTFTKANPHALILNIEKTTDHFCLNNHS